MDFHRSLGDLLVQEGLASEEKVRGARERQEQGGPSLGVCLVEDGVLSEEHLAEVVALEYKVSRVDPRQKKVRPECLGLITRALAQRFLLLPLLLKKVNGRRALYVAMADPTNLEAIESVEFCTGATVKPVVSTVTQIREAITRNYGVEEEGEPCEEGDGGAVQTSGAETGSDEAPGEGGRGEPTRRILQAITELLIEKNVISKEELMARVERTVHQRESDGRHGKAV